MVSMCAILHKQHANTFPRRTCFSHECACSKDTGALPGTHNVAAATAAAPQCIAPSYTSVLATSMMSCAMRYCLVSGTTDCGCASASTRNRLLPRPASWAARLDTRGGSW